MRPLDERQCAPLDPEPIGLAAMTDTPAAAIATEARAGGPDVIYLPDQSQPRARKKITSGSNKRQRRHLERFRTDDAEHAALHARLNGESLGAYVMRLLGIEGGMETRARQRGRPSVDAVALTRAMVDFSREHNNYNQAVRALNTLVLMAEERSSTELADEIRRLQSIVEDLQTQFAAPLAAIQAVLGHVREG